jgi:GWxTD domain-containing protein
MAAPTRSGRRLAAALPLLTSLWLGCRAADRPSETGFLRAWAEGPARWLLLPDEQHWLHELRTHAEAVAFVAAFWRRRDPDGSRPGNPCEEEFERRVAAADRLYGEGDVRGSLTDRGRALVLLGPPSVLNYGQKPVPAWEPGPLGGKPAVETRRIAVESWVYEPEDLPPRLRQQLAEEGRPETVELVFVVEPERTHLTEGDKFLETAARALLVEPSP